MSDDDACKTILSRFPAKTSFVYFNFVQFPLLLSESPDNSIGHGILLIDMITTVTLFRRIT